MTVVVTIELIKTPVTEENSSTTVGLTLTASPAGASSGSDSESPGMNVNSSIVYNAWYRFEVDGMRTSYLFRENGTVFMELSSDEFNICTGKSDFFTINGNKIVNGAGETLTISEDKKAITDDMNGSVMTLDESILNPQLTYFRYNEEVFYVVFEPGETWAEFCTRTNSLWEVYDDGFVYENDTVSSYPIMDSNRNVVKGTDLIVDGALYLCDKPQ